MKETIEATIRRAIPDASVRVDSPDGTHWTATVVSPSFAGMTLVRQHQMVMGALRAEFDAERLHALELRTMTP
jgi:stress-induced morphogen